MISTIDDYDRYENRATANAAPSRIYAASTFAPAAGICAKRMRGEQGVAPHGLADICTVRLSARRVGRGKLVFAVGGVIFELATGFLRLSPPFVDRL
jgi:hypothetical protein